MTESPKQILLDTLALITDPEQRALADQIVLDSTALAARVALGEDVSKELAHVKAQAANLGAAAAAITRSAVIDLVTAVVSRVLIR